MATKTSRRVIYIDAIHFSVREDGKISKIAAYIILALNEFGLKEVLGIYVGENDSSKYWLGIFNKLKSRGVKGIWVLCSDGLTGIKEAIAVASLRRSIKLALFTW